MPLISLDEYHSISPCSALLCCIFGKVATPSPAYAAIDLVGIPQRKSREDWTTAESTLERLDISFCTAKQQASKASQSE